MNNNTSTHLHVGIASAFHRGRVPRGVLRADPWRGHGVRPGQEGADAVQALQTVVAAVQARQRVHWQAQAQRGRAATVAC